LTRPESDQKRTEEGRTGNRDVAVVVVAAGSGSRMGGTLPKQYCNLAGETVLARAISCFADHPRVGSIQPVISANAFALFNDASGSLSGLDRLRQPVTGGATRQASVLAGLEALSDEKPGIVLITDAARPFVTAEQIDRLLDALDAGERAVIPAVPVVDTLKKADANRMIVSTVPRNDLHRVQTPQAFHFATILDAHRSLAENDFTDDAAVAEASGIAVRLVDGDPRNVKLTHPEDFLMAEATMQTPRTGTGFDVHRLISGDGIMLCGVFINCDKRLSGHSDADVGLHALTDALLGAIGEGDIGDHFPPGDPQWKGAESAQFLSHAASLVSGKGGRITHVDVTLICERPKIGPHKPEMKQRIAEILGIDCDRVSVKATTTEKLGFTGRGEGIAAQAVATVLV